MEASLKAKSSLCAWLEQEDSEFYLHKYALQPCPCMESSISQFKLKTS